MIRTEMSRRHALTVAAGVTAASLASGGVLAAPAAAAPAVTGAPPHRNDRLKKALSDLADRRRRLLTGRPSGNGWEMQKAVDAEGEIVTHSVAGTGLRVSLREGDAATLLLHVVRRFHYEIDALGLPGEPTPIQGWVAPGKVRDTARPRSNQASGTAVVIRPGTYPPGVRGGLTAAQQLVLRDVIADTEGLVRWGGDDRPADEGLFYLAVGPDDTNLPGVAAKLRAWRETPGRGAGVIVDVAEPTRRRRAERFR
ncbi:hypothetical protein OHT61_25525 [Streptomyces sp. NBC_00178]|uniref:hypothetical protein n=1 Tax=Streptomyces sp. NBC_00178 TaxID=2975672 RepID=UPI002E2C5945|nr:hypothetical protein [Streptomyces sp. NBC_00178]